MTIIERLLKSYLHYPIDWDSYGGLPLRKDVYDLAQLILSFTKSKDLPDPCLSLGYDGTVALWWFREEWEMVIEVTSGESVSVLLHLSDDNHLDNAIEYEIKKDLPQSLSGSLEWFHKQQG